MQSGWLKAKCCQVVRSQEGFCGNSKRSHARQVLEAAHVAQHQAAVQAVRLPEQGSCQATGREGDQDPRRLGGH